MPGTYRVAADFAGEGQYLPTSAQQELEVVEFREDVVSRYNSFLPWMREREPRISAQTTPREMEVMVVEGGTPIDHRALEVVVARFERGGLQPARNRPAPVRGDVPGPPEDSGRLNRHGSQWRLTGSVFQAVLIAAGAVVLWGLEDSPLPKSSLGLDFLLWPVAITAGLSLAVDLVFRLQRVVPAEGCAASA